MNSPIAAASCDQSLLNQLEIVLAGQNREHHKPPEVLKSQVFRFGSAGGILAASELLLFGEYERQHLAYITM